MQSESDLLKYFDDDKFIFDDFEEKCKVANRRRTRKELVDMDSDEYDEARGELNEMNERDRIEYCRKSDSNARNKNHKSSKLFKTNADSSSEESSSSEEEESSSSEEESSSSEEESSSEESSADDAPIVSSNKKK